MTHLTTSASNFPLDRLQMSGCYPLTDASIDAELSRQSPGNYALGYQADESFVVCYVGRSDSDLRQHLHEWVGRPSPFDRYAPLTKAPWTTRAHRTWPLGSPAAAAVGAGPESAYLYFAFSYAPSAEAAFEKQCRNYDDFGGASGLDNRRPPAPPPVIH